MGKKCPLKTIVLAVDEKEKAIKSSWGRAQSWWRPSRAWVARVECWWHGKVPWKMKWRTTTKWNDNQHHKNLLEVLPTTIAGSFWSKLSKMSYSESEPDFSNFAINSLSYFASIFSESKSESESESDFHSVFINLEICDFFILYLHSSK